MFSPRRWLALVVVLAFSAATARAAELNKFLPEDTEIVVGIDVTTVIGSGLVQKHVPALVKQYGPDLVKLAVAGGLKIDEDVQKELLKIIGDADAMRKWLNDNKAVVRRVLITTSADFDDSNAFLLFEGDFNKDKMKELFDDLAKRKPFGVVVKTVKQDKQEFYSVTVPGDEEPMHVAVADDKTIVCCQAKEALAKALEAAARGKSARKELLAVAKKIDPKASLWMAAAPKEADEYVSAHGGIVLTEGIRITASIASKDADGAKKIASEMSDSLKDVVAELENVAKQLPPLGALRDIVKKVEPKVDGVVVTVEVEVPGATLDKLIKELPSIK